MRAHVCDYHCAFLAFYLLCGVAAAVAQAVMSPGSTLPMVGASGAISGVLGAYFLLHPLASIRVLFFLGFIPIVAHVPALVCHPNRRRTVFPAELNQAASGGFLKSIPD